MSTRRVLAMCAAVASAVTLAACGSDNGGGGAGGEEAGVTEGAKVIDPALAESAKGVGGRAAQPVHPAPAGEVG